MTINTTFVSGAILTAAQMNNLPWGSAGYASSTTLNQNVTTLTDITGLSVTFTAVAGRIYRVDGYVMMNSTEGTNPAVLSIRNGATALQQSTLNLQIANTNYMAAASYVGTFTAGSVTVKLSGARGAGSGTITAQSTSTYPAQIIVTDIGAS